MQWKVDEVIVQYKKDRKKLLDECQIAPIKRVKVSISNKRELVAQVLQFCSILFTI